MKLKPLLSILLLAFSLLLAMMLSLLYVQQIGQAQGSSITMSKTLNKSTNVVRVGEVLSFTIALTNTAGFTLTNVTLVDVYSATILGFAGAIPPPDTTSTGALTWTNVAAPPIGIGQSLTFTVFFTAEHPQTAVVNFARAQDITGTGQAVATTAATNQSGDVIGGTAPVVKFLSPPGSVPQTGLPLTFTHVITNDGAAMMTRLPLTDTYNPAFLQFHFAVPTPTIISPGLLVWTDLTTYFGNIPPFGTVVVTTVFTATTQVLNTSVNSATAEGALDEYNNDLTSNVAQAPITIIADTPTPVPQAPQDDSGDNSPTPVPASTSISSPSAGQEITTSSQTDTSAPLYLPETGWLQANKFVVPILGLILLTFGWYFFRKFDNR